MNKTTKAIIVIAILGGGTYFFWDKFLSPKALVAKRLDTDFPENKPHRQWVNYQYKINPDYIKNWVKAIKKGETKFTFNNKEYYVQGGSATKK